MQPVVSQGDSVIKVKSLPYDACQLDVLQFFDGFKIRPNGVQLVIQGNNKPSGEVKRVAIDPYWGCHQSLWLMFGVPCCAGFC